MSVHKYRVLVLVMNADSRQCSGNGYMLFPCPRHKKAARELGSHQRAVRRQNNGTGCWELWVGGSK